jgi:TM2 domain-containing membrane protein YozV
MEETPPTPPEGDQSPPPSSDSTPPPPPPPSAPPPPSFTPPDQITAPPGGYTTGTTAKSPILSLILSLIVPGLGQIINGETTKGIIFIVAIVVAYLTCFIIIGFIAVPAVMAYAAYDAFQGAKSWNVAHGYPPGA